MKIGDKVQLITHEKSLVHSMYVKLNSKGKILHIDEKDNTAKVEFTNNTPDWFWVKLNCLEILNETEMQTLTRKQLITLHSQFTCTEWKTTIEELLKENVFEEKIDVSSKLELLKSKGTEEQKEAVKKLKIILPKSYLELHNGSGLKVGDKVKVIRKATTHEQGWNNSWTFEMNGYVGKSFIIQRDRKEYGFESQNGFNNPDFPYFVLEKVEEKYVPYTFEDSEKLIGKTIKSKDESVFCIIVYVSDSLIYRGDGFRINYVELLENWTELDGTPLGKLTEIN